MKALMLVLSLLFAVSCAHTGHHGKASACKTKRWKKMDANSDGKVSKDEFIKAKTDKFMKMDMNKDGSVTLEEKMNWKKAKKKNCKSCKS